MGDTKQINAQIPLGKRAYLSHRMIAGMLSGVVAFTFSGGFAVGYFAKRGMTETIRIEEKRLEPRYPTVDVLSGCSNFSLLRVRWKVISNYIRDMAHYEGGEGLEGVYDTIHPRMLQIAQNTNVSNLMYTDDLDMLMRLPRTSKDERLSMVFLSLPRLAERGIPHRSDPAFSIERAKVDSEIRFMRRLHQESPEAAALVERYWYKENGSLPAPGDEKKFFHEFAKLYPSGQAI